MSQPLRALLVEDSPDDALCVEHYLTKGGFAVSSQRVQTIEALRKLLQEQSWDIVIADYKLPTFDGLQALRVCQEKTPDLPVIIMSGFVPEEFVVDAMRAGARDFIPKDRLVRLAPSVRRTLQETEVRRARRAAEGLRAAIENTIPSGISIVDAEGKITYVNPAFCKLVGWSEANLIGSKPPYLYWPPGEAGTYEEQFWKAAEEPGTSAAERRFRRADGAEIFVLRLSTVLQEPGGRKSMLASFTDITELKRKDEALRKLNEELERRVEQRTADLNKALLEIREHVEARKRLENELLEIVEKERQRLGLELHDDLGQRLSGLMMMTKGLEIKLKKKHRPEALQASNIHVNLEETVSLARGMAKNLVPWNFKEGSLAQALKSLAEQNRSLFGVACHFQSQGDIPKLKPEFEMHLYKIAQEAVSNGVKHGKAREVQINLTQMDGVLRLAVKNNGLPFPAVDPFKTGSGLRIMHYRANLLGATLDVKSRAKAGTEVTCSLRLKKDEAQTSKGATAKSAAEGGLKNPGA